MKALANTPKNLRVNASTVHLLSGMVYNIPRDILRNVCRAAGIATGRNRTNTIRNISQAILDGKLNLAATLAIKMPKKSGELMAKKICAGKFRSYGNRPFQRFVTPSSNTK